MFKGIENLVADTRYFAYKADDVIPEPNSCSHCGDPKRFHAMSYAENVGYHSWTQPDNALILARMKARRKVRALTQTTENMV